MGDKMGAQENLNTLWAWLPYLAEGFLLNVLISVMAMFLGTVLGWWLGVARAGQVKVLRFASTGLTSLLRNIPSFVFMFYIAFVTPVEFEWDGALIAIPAWIKAVVALTIPVVGFCSDQVDILINAQQRKAAHAFATFAVAWTQYLLVIIMASATASVIGVDEIVGRANTVIAAVGEPSLILWVYGFVALWFLASGLVFSQSLRYARYRLHDKRGHMRLEEG